MMRAAVAVLMMASTWGWAPPTVEEALHAVEAAEARLAAGAGGDALREVIAARTALLRVGAEDWRAATWRLDSAEDILRLAGSDGSDLSVWFGAPTGEQRATVRGMAEEALRAVEDAGRDIDRTVASLEAELFAARADTARAAKVSAEIEPRLRVLLDVEQAWRAPMLRARAELLLLSGVESAGVAERRARAERVALSLEGLAAPDDAGEEVRDLLAGTARALAGQASTAGGVFARLRGHGGTGVREHATLGALATAANLAGARALASEVVQGIDEAPTGVAMLRAEAVARAILSRAPEDTTRAAAQREALVALAGVVRRVIPVADGDTLGRRVLEKAWAVSEGSAGAGGGGWGRVDAGALDPEMQYARAVEQLRVPGSAGEGSRAVARLAQDATITPSVREAALWTWGGVPGGSGVLDVPTRLVRLAREFPGSPRADEALAKAEAMLRPLMEGRDSAALALQREVIGLRLARTTDPRAVRELRVLRLANAALDEGWKGSSAEVATLVSEYPEWEDAEAARRGADVTNMTIVLDRAIAAGGSPAEREAVARAACGWARAHAPAVFARAALARAEALVDQGDAKAALAQLDEIGPLEKSGLGTARMNRARLARGRALRGAGSQEAAFALLRAQGNGARPEVFWAAWAEMLEILLHDGATGARAADIRLHVNRLRLIDPALGGEATRARIERASAGAK
jgi:hypothetical protein